MAALALIIAASCSNSNGNSDTAGAVPAKVVEDTINNAGAVQDTASPKTEDSLRNIEAVNDDLKEAISAELKEKEEKAKAAAEKLKEKGKEGIQKGADAVADKAQEISDKFSN